jgi:PPOX class probable F420-dependent enzyme
MPRSDRLSPTGVLLLQEKHLAVLSTLMPDGSPQSTPVWVDVEPDGSRILVNTVVGHLKEKNITRDPRVAVTVVDAQNPFRSIVIRGKVVEMTGHDEGAKEHIDRLAQKYTGQERYQLRQGERRVMLRIKPDHVVERGAADLNAWRERRS